MAKAGGGNLRGRPRRNPRPLKRPPVEEILFAAGRLFAQKGFAGTSTREIAEAAGLQQPSLFHYFGSKEEILRALSERALIRPLDALEAISAGPGRASAKLFLIISFHVRHLCSEPFDLTGVIGSMTVLPRKRFRSWYEGVDRYTHGLRALIEQGTEAGDFMRTDATTATMAILGMVNWTIRWYDRRGRLSSAELGDEFARFALRSLLRDPRRIQHVATEAHRLEGSTSAMALLGPSS
jgi:AcrR family transcriptional regulator